MFDLYNSDRTRQQETPKEKQVYLIQNGFPDRLFQHSFKRLLTREQVMRSCDKHWGLGKYKSLRLFSVEGVQLLEQDMQYVRDGERIYVSRGDQFDSTRNFGEYELLRVLGEGGFGKVSLGRNTITKELSAIKVIKLQKICGADDIDMVFREIENLKALKHPHIVKILNCYTLQNMQVVVVMEYLEGGQLLQLLKKHNHFEEQLARHFFKQIVSAVAYCHAQNIIHRDLKLENILLTKKTCHYSLGCQAQKDSVESNLSDPYQQTLKVADFGISGVADRFNPDVDTGTLKYMSPQVLAGKQKSNTPAVDVWACGVVLYYMLFGVLPFIGSSSSQIILAITTGKYQLPKHTLISDECKDLLQHMLEVNPKKRIKMSEIEDSPWLISTISPTISSRVKDQVIEEQNLVRKDSKLVKKVLMQPRISPMLIPKRLQKERHRVIQQLQVYGVDHRRIYRSENKPYASQELPSINSYHSRGSRHQIQILQQRKRKRSSLNTNLWK